MIVEQDLTRVTDDRLTELYTHVATGVETDPRVCQAVQAEFARRSDLRERGLYQTPPVSRNPPVTQPPQQGNPYTYHAPPSGPYPASGHPPPPGSPYRQQPPPATTGTYNYAPPQGHAQQQNPYGQPQQRPAYPAGSPGSVSQHPSYPSPATQTYNPPQQQPVMRPGPYHAHTQSQPPSHAPPHTQQNQPPPRTTAAPPRTTAAPPQHHQAHGQQTYYGQHGRAQSGPPAVSQAAPLHTASATSQRPPQQQPAPAPPATSSSSSVLSANTRGGSSGTTGAASSKQSSGSKKGFGSITGFGKKAINLGKKTAGKAITGTKKGLGSIGSKMTGSSNKSNMRARREELAPQVEKSTVNLKVLLRHHEIDVLNLLTLSPPVHDHAALVTFVSENHIFNGQLHELAELIGHPEAVLIGEMMTDPKTHCEELAASAAALVELCHSRHEDDPFNIGRASTSSVTRHADVGDSRTTSVPPAVPVPNTEFGQQNDPMVSPRGGQSQALAPEPRVIPARLSTADDAGSDTGPPSPWSNPGRKPTLDELPPAPQPRLRTSSQAAPSDKNSGDDGALKPMASGRRHSRSDYTDNEIAAMMAPPTSGEPDNLRPVFTLPGGDIDRSPPPTQPAPQPAIPPPTHTQAPSPPAAVETPPPPPPARPAPSPQNNTAQAHPHPPVVKHAESVPAIVLHEPSQDAQLGRETAPSMMSPVPDNHMEMSKSTPMLTPENLHSLNGGQPEPAKKGPKSVASELDFEEMKERFGRILLGEDLSGGTSGRSPSFTINNAITNLASGVFGEMKELEPMSEKAVQKWQKEMEWYTTPCEHIVERETAFKETDKGDKIEILVSVQRKDIRHALPTLRSIDAKLQGVLAGYASKEFTYTSGDQQPAGDGSAGRATKWWIHKPVVPALGLSEPALKQLRADIATCIECYNDAHGINVDTLNRMAIPQEFIDDLPKTAKAILGSDAYKCVSGRTPLPYTDFVRRLNIATIQAALPIVSALEKAVIIWGLKGSDREEKDTHAKTYLRLLRDGFPNMEQTELETSKIRHNKDVGFAVLEAYSRVLEGRASSIKARIQDVLDADFEVREGLGEIGIG